jgi:SAM-dependent methyltransferase
MVQAGDFNRLLPFDDNFGFNRGGPVDRVYIEKFLESNTSAIKGRVLEIGDNTYTLKYGGSKITLSDILHINADDPKATFTGDLSHAPNLPDCAFDCIILTQTLHLIYDFKGALQTCRRILKPGGVLLLTVPGISPIDKGEWGANWYWSFTQKSIEKLSAEIFNPDKHEINIYGNVFAASAFLYGMGAPELNDEQLFFQDPQFPVIITLKVAKGL